MDNHGNRGKPGTGNGGQDGEVSALPDTAIPNFLLDILIIYAIIVFR
jgi:hypothetical protein